jgi:hypothetical protein
MAHTSSRSAHLAYTQTSCIPQGTAHPLHMCGNAAAALQVKNLQQEALVVAKTGAGCSTPMLPPCCTFAAPVQLVSRLLLLASPAAVPAERLIQQGQRPEGPNSSRLLTGCSECKLRTLTSYIGK